MQNMIDRALVSPLSLLPVPMGRQMVGGQDRSQTMSLPQASGARQLFIDVSVISREDARTGIKGWFARFCCTLPRSPLQAGPSGSFEPPSIKGIALHPTSLGCRALGRWVGSRFV